MLLLSGGMEIEKLSVSKMKPKKQHDLTDKRILLPLLIKKSNEVNSFDVVKMLSVHWSCDEAMRRKSSK